MPVTGLAVAMGDGGRRSCGLRNSVSEHLHRLGEERNTPGSRALELNPTVDAYAGQINPVSTRDLIILCNTIGILLGVFSIAGGIYMCIICLGGLNDSVMFNGLQCTVQQKYGGPVGIVLGCFAVSISSFLLHAGIQTHPSLQHRPKTPSNISLESVTK
eukprot:GHVT01042532.1.p1 GENE.GHVT01042532.1~~GHVT01042532.1.p1  ORF type:complete len:159 (+),score=7.33 GHVT01042532.1:1390-1866(+)